MTRTLAEGIDLRALVDHDTGKPLGRLKAGTLRVEPDAHGLRVEIDPPNTTAGHDIVESIRRGDVGGDESSRSGRWPTPGTRRGRRRSAR